MRLASVLHTGVKVRGYLYVDNDGLAKKVVIFYIEMLTKRFPTIFPRFATKRAFIALQSDISLISSDELTRHGPIDFVIRGWPSYRMSMARHVYGLKHSRSACFRDMTMVL